MYISQDLGHCFNLTKVTVLTIPSPLATYVYNANTCSTVPDHLPPLADLKEAASDQGLHYSQISISRTRISRVLGKSKHLFQSKIHFDCFLIP